MGKRSDFDRVEKDFYRTIDPRAVEALAPFLSPKTKFAEPCYGQGDLADWLETEGHRMEYYSDLVPMYKNVVHKDALTLTYDDIHECDYIITNPPWSRPILHKMIDHFRKLKPTWLLFDADWMHTRQSSEYIKYCSDIVSVGRLVWIPGTKTQGKDNCAWYKFQSTQQETKFHGRN